MSPDPCAPVIVGVAQRTQRPADPMQSLEPGLLMAATVEDALVDAGSAQRRPGAADLAMIVVVQGAWSYRDPGRLVADRIGAPSAVTAITSTGGQAPQVALNRLCRRIQDGSIEAAVLTGGETIWTRRRLRRIGVKLATGGDDHVPRAEVWGDDVALSTPFETKRGIDQPIVVYPLFESALRASRGESLAAHRDRLARLWTGFNRIAVDNPYSWRRDPLTEEEIRDPTPTNRMVGFPYTKAMNSNWDVDMASAVVVCSVRQATRWGVEPDRWVFCQAGTEADDTLAVSHRRDLHSSPAISAAGRRLFELGQVNDDEINALTVDLYSCFPSAVQVAAAELGLRPERELTVTGGLTFAGGPLNNYVGHSIATVVDRLRTTGGRALVTANGGYLTKHAIGLLGSSPGPDGRFHWDNVQSNVDRIPSTPCDEGFAGTARIEAYTVMHDHNGPRRGPCALRTPDGARTWGSVTDIDMLHEMMAIEAVGRNVNLMPDGTATMIP
jgi:acetyl-CoA C-acetyltransferase